MSTFQDEASAALAWSSHVLGAALLAVVGIILVLHGVSYAWMYVRWYFAGFRLGAPFTPSTVRFKPASNAAAESRATSSAPSPSKSAGAATSSFSPAPTPDIADANRQSSEAAAMAALAVEVGRGGDKQLLARPDARIADANRQSSEAVAMAALAPTPTPSGANLNTPMTSTTATSSSAVPKQQPVVLITGGAMGIGRLVAERYAALGYHVIIWDVMPAAAAAKVVAEISASPNVPSHAIVESTTVDATSIDAVAAATAGLESRGLVPDLLILNAGVVNGRRIVTSPAALPKVKRLLDVNVFHLYNVTGHVIPRMLAAAMREEMRSGRPLHRGVVVLGSVAGFAGTARMCDYNASKAAANVFAEALAAEIKMSCGGSVGFRVTLVCPYQINTGMFAGAKTITGFKELEAADVADAIVRGVALKRRLIVMPYILLFWLAFKALVPWWLVNWADWLLGASKVMATYRGRQQDQAGGTPAAAGKPADPAVANEVASKMAETPAAIDAMLERRRKSAASPPPPFIPPEDLEAIAGASMRTKTEGGANNNNGSSNNSEKDSSPDAVPSTSFPGTPGVDGGDEEVSKCLAATASVETLPPSKSGAATPDAEPLSPAPKKAGSAQEPQQQLRQRQRKSKSKSARREN
eukprot:CAMPEP_0174882116 /NCGR_PEP_ID=MMETSP1114-20130205/84601_1 /TAXON_ID=312471 /ORGANISM="Neobodo designis, Strain CCAP 1951/1" /LENGTH=639 /DNA_ID=CAMNT_0016117513 /DNA_START=14 /DNA_END=1934 /DNA_ORIENTATION=-